MQLRRSFFISFLLPLLLPVVLLHAHWTDDLDLPRELLEYKVRNDKVLKKKCLKDPDCPFTKEVLNNGRCWGYEPSCTMKQSYSADRVKCNLPMRNDRWKDKKAEQLDYFYSQGDWGYTKGEGRSNMHTICSSTDKEKTRITCSDHLAYCNVENIFFDFSNLRAKTSSRYRDNVILNGHVGGNCESFHKTVLDEHLDRESYLQSWASELKHFRSSSAFAVTDEHCDVIFHRPTMIIKLDASINMFHHFCDFINMYASQHMNGSNFDTDIDIVWWDTAPNGFIDSFFGATWSAFTRHTPVELIALDGKRVCFKNAMLPLLARQRFGMYYNMPVVEGCHGSGLMHAFSHHLLHRLAVPQNGPLLDTVRVTILSRSTPHRRMMNEKELLDRLQSLPGIQARIVDYNGRMPFLQQLESTHNTDVFVGMHGSGLTHLLFLPDWAAIFEVYNCEDERCYNDLARLRGVRYATWSDSSKMRAHGEGKHPHNGSPHAKFTDYSFDVDEFERIVKQLAEYVRRHPLFVEQQRKLRRKTKGEL